MSTVVELSSITPWTFAASLAAAPEASPWSLVAVPGDQLEPSAGGVVDQLASLLDVPAELVRVTSPQEIVVAAKQRNASALVIIGLDAFDSAAWRQLDAHRSDLARDLPAVMVIGEPHVHAVLEQAPNLWSWLAGSAWLLTPEQGLRADQREQRLAALREHFGFGDEELVRRAQGRTLGTEPDLAEWLVLIGQGHLIRT